MKSRANDILDILKPSWAEIAFLFLTLLAMAAYLILKGFYELGDVQTYFAYIEKNPTDLQYEYGAMSDSVNSSKFAADGAVFAVWAFTGLIGYGLIESCVSFFKNLKHFNDSLSYSHTNKSEIVKESVEKFVIRAIACVLMYLLITTIITYVVPAVLVNLLNVTATDLVNSVILILGVIAILAAVVHATTILLRTILLRRRIVLSYDSIRE